MIVHEVDRDRYGRVVGWVVFTGGQTLNQEMVRAGMAWWYRRYAPKEQGLRSAEEEARLHGIGLWKDAHPVAPWEFRKAKRTRKSRPSSLEEWFYGR